MLFRCIGSHGRACFVARAREAGRFRWQHQLEVARAVWPVFCLSSLIPPRFLPLLLYWITMFSPGCCALYSATGIIFTVSCWFGWMNKWKEKVPTIFTQSAVQSTNPFCCLWWLPRLFSILDDLLLCFKLCDQHWKEFSKTTRWCVRWIFDDAIRRQLHTPFYCISLWKLDFPCWQFPEWRA